jgi:amino acid transporter, AAT family
MSKMKNRHIQMIAIGGAIGTGLFFGAAKSIAETGPSIILSYLIGGIVMYVIMRALGEMTVYEPNFGAYSHYAYKYVGEYLGFVSGWFAWFEYTIVCMLEVTAVAVFLDYWLPGVPHWITIAIILVIFFAINMLNVKVFGEFEFWFAGIKVATIILMIIFAAYLIFFNSTTTAESIANIKTTIHSNMFPKGAFGFLSSFVLVIFSFGGAQFLGIAAADAEDIPNTVPKAVRGVIARIIIFYVGTFLAILCLYPWQKLNANVSPFIDVFDKVGLHMAAKVMSIVVITAALSAFNSCLYSAIRMLANLARHESAPGFLAKVDKNNVPKNALYITSLILVSAVVINYIFPKHAIMYLIGITTASVIITWTTIILCHIGFRKKIPIEKIEYKLPFFPYLNYIALFILFLVVIIMFAMSDMRNAVYFMPIWIAIVTVFYFIKRFIKS